MGHVLFQEDKYFAESTDPIIKEIWNKKEFAQSGESDYGECYETVKNIYEGGHIRFDWRSGLQCSANIKYAKPDGTRMVIINKDHGILDQRAHLAGFQRKIKG